MCRDIKNSILTQHRHRDIFLSSFILFLYYLRIKHGNKHKEKKFIFIKVKESPKGQGEKRK